MYRDFIVKQTSDYPSEYKAKTLVGNWYEERCNPLNVQNFHFYKERKDPEQAQKPILTQVTHHLNRTPSNNPPATGSTSKNTIPGKPSKQNISKPHSIQR